ncbi:PucR family transcriptional regulator [Paenibacillus humicola]|uniref:PucR family transcriptional regulator n=1 Tax=Paenibacillus humicola TaxID=3110540 RepID=UPI00237A38C3|nr:helix-turn-helix domain-containing protein [Paenibacillus humicola]
MIDKKWIEQLQAILESPVRHLRISFDEWHEHQMNGRNGGGQRKAKVTPGDSIQREDGQLMFAIRSDQQEVEAVAIPSEAVSKQTARLIGWALDQLRGHAVKGQESISETERHAKELGDWIAEQLDLSEPQTTIPDRYAAKGRLFSEMIPFLLVCVQSETGRSSYSELEKLLRTFLSEEAMLIPLKEQEWLILGPITLIQDAQSEDKDEESEESLEESLGQIASGLHDMLASEWIGECHLAVSYPISPASSLIATAQLLRETINLGRTFHVGTNIHLPWLLHLERLLSAIPETQRIKFVEQALKRTDVFLEPEILTTLETFFSLDCNVSETAKKLYIHRNTLLYRLDKLKQETELDVRQFRDAVLVKIILLLYKVTKRK